MMRRLFLSAIVIVMVFAWGVTTGLHRTFPWDYFEPVQQRISRALWILGAFGPDPAAVQPEQTVVERTSFRLDTGLLNFDGVVLNAGTRIDGISGAMAVVGNGVLIARQLDGRLWHYEPESDALRLLGIALPPTGAEQMPARTPLGRDISGTWLRYHDVAFAARGELLASYTRYNPAGTCFELVLARAQLPENWLTAGELSWETLFVAAPCLPFSEDRNVIGGNQAGGRIVIAPDGALYLSTGDFEFDGLDSKAQRVSQDPGSTLGRVLRIDPDSGTATEVSRGHRNPQGLAFVDGQLWSVEHGAMGGDEFNLIVPGSDYGWPSVTLGVNYADRTSDEKLWPFNPSQGRHDGFTAPLLAWLPSIAPSTLMVVRDVHPRWNGDFLVATLGDQSLRRLRLESSRVLYDERIAMDGRIRDIAELEGRIYVLFDDGRFGYLSPRSMADVAGAAPPQMQVLAESDCVSCHSSPALPRLAGIADRDIASQEGVRYSAALQGVDGTWTRERLMAFLADPDAFAPGTTMPATALADDTLKVLVDALMALEP